MKYFIKIVSDVAIGVYRNDEKWSDNDHEITEEQFTEWAFPCRVEVTDDGVMLGDMVPWEELPDMSEPGAPNPEPIPDPIPTAQEDNDAMLVDHEYRITMLELGITEV